MSALPMTADLVARLLAHAEVHAQSSSPHDDEQAQWERDLREAASALRSKGEAIGYIAETDAKPGVATVIYDSPDRIAAVWADRKAVAIYLHPATPASAWRPIAEAPTEPNARVILCCESLHDGNPPVVGEAYRASDGEWWWAQTGPNDYHADPIADTNGAPILWQPLPTPPTSTKGG